MKRREMEAMVELAERMVLADKLDDMIRIAALRSLERTEIAPDETPSIEVTEDDKDDTPDGLEEMYAAWAEEAEAERKQLEEEDKIAEAYEHERQQQNRRGCRCGRKLRPETEREQRIMECWLEMDMRTGEIRLA